ncbi:ParB N-terminal domain-containing protein [Microbacterium profundi]|uniref:ParB N-terminal domain-containing protein n=1 Tax=Microbacterium profundi TaxID=450380 RepID=A0ABV3LFE9_9MICO
MTVPQTGSIQLDRAVDSLIVGTRHRADLGDIDALAASIERDGLLQPLTITIDGVLVCGARRLAAIKRLGWRTVNVWVRSGLSDRLGQLLAEQDDNMLHKPYTQLEAAGLYREIKQVMAEDAARRKAATQFSSENQPGNDGGANFAPPSDGQLGKTRAQAAAMIPGGASHTTLEKINYLQQLADDQTQPETLRAEATAGLERIEAGAAVHPIYQAIRDADTVTRERREAKLHARAEAAVAHAKSLKKGKPTPPRPLPVVADDGQPVRYPVRAFIQTWGELANWWTHYDADTLARELTDVQFENFLATVEGTTRFAETLHAAREDTAEHPHLRAL